LTPNRLAQPLASNTLLSKHARPTLRASRFFCPEDKFSINEKEDSANDKKQR
jgi:hypothetical protein